VKIAALYDVLIQVEPSPIVDLNRAVAIAMRDMAGLQRIDALLAQGDLIDYHLAHAARAICRRLGRKADAKSYQRALTLVKGTRAAVSQKRLDEWTEKFCPPVDLPPHRTTTR